jgi:hypothetical protein
MVKYFFFEFQFVYESMIRIWSSFCSNDISKLSFYCFIMLQYFSQDDVRREVTVEGAGAHGGDPQRQV